MKSVPWIVWAAFAVVAGTGWGLWIHDKWVKPSVPTQMTHFMPPHPPAFHPPIVQAPDRNEWQQYSVLRQKILVENPGLASEYKELLAEAQAQQQKLAAAMVSADPKVGAIMTKLEALHQHSPNHAENPPTANPVTR